MNRLVALAALSGVVSAPLSASVREAAFSSSGETRVAQSSMFAGATLGVRPDRSTGQPKARAGLAVAGMTRAPGSDQVRFGDGLELAAGKSGKPSLRLAGQDVGELGKRTNLSTGAAIAIGVGVVLLVGAAVLVASKPWECRSDGAPCD
jgi:hypothetical protein